MMYVLVQMKIYFITFTVAMVVILVVIFLLWQWILPFQFIVLVVRKCRRLHFLYCVPLHCHYP